MRYYPVAVDTKDKKILVVGGGRAAFLKLKGLVNSCAVTTVISKEFCKDILYLKESDNQRLKLERRTIVKEKIDFSHDYSMAFICTDDKELNHELYEYFKNKKTLVMMADNTECSDFINSAVLERDNITIAFNTQGRSPTAAKLLLKETEKILTDELIERIDLICKIREKLKSQKYLDSSEKDLHIMMESIVLCSKEDLEEKLGRL